MTDLSPASQKRVKALRPLSMLVPFIAPYKGTLLLAMIALLVSSAALLAMPMAVRNVIDHGFSAADAANVNRYFFVLLLFALIIGFFGAARAYFVNWLGERVVADLREQVFRHVVRMDPTFFDVTRVGEVLSRLTADTTLIQSISGVGISIVLRSSIQFIGALALLAYTNVQLMGLLVVVLPLVIVPILLIGRWVRRLSKDTQDRVADASGHAEEILNAVEIVQAFTAEELESQRFGGAVESSFRVAVRRIRVRALLTTVGTSGVFGALIFVLWVGAKAVLDGELSGGELGQFVLYAIFVGASAAALSEFWGEVQRASGAMERIAELLGVVPAIQAPSEPLVLPTVIDGRVSFEAVDFSYPSRSGELALNGFNLTIAAGENIAFVGPSGAGKSTLFQLLLRFYNTGAGRILIDDIDIALADPEAIRHCLGIVPQETTIFGATAAENIRFGKPGASMEEIRAAARAASADEFIDKLPQGYDTFLGEKGARLSGGQKQRIAIARAVLRDPKILLLDEATSALDAEGERLVQAAIERVMQGRTAVVIAHRLSTVRHADRIIVMDRGGIAESGSHEQLMAAGGVYHGMVALQQLEG